jgi:cellulose synthase operon protein C
MKLFGAIAISSLLASPSFAQPEAWQALWQNRAPEAKKLFEGKLSTAPDDVEALRGLGWIASLRSDNEAVLSSWGRALETHPEAPEGLALWPKVETVAISLGRWDWLEKLCQGIVANPKSLPELKLNAQGALTLIDLVRKQGKEGEYPGRVGNWQVLGPLDNTAGVSFSKQLPFEKGQAETEVRGKSGQRLKWQKSNLTGKTAVDLNWLSDGEDEVFYAVTAIQSPSESQVQLLFDSVGSSRLWLNGKQIFEHSTGGSNQAIFMPFSQSVTLRQGWNTVAVKIGVQDRQGDPRFTLIARDASGQPLTLPSDPAQADRSLQLTTGLAESNTTSIERIKQSASSPDYDLLLAALLAENGQHDESVDLLKNGLKQHPDSGLWLWELSRRASQDRRVDESRGYRVQALKADKDIVEAEVDQLFDQRPSQESVKRLKEITAQYPKFSTGYLALYSHQKEVGLDEEAVKTLNSLMTLEIGSRRRASMRSAYSKNGMFAEADRQLELALKETPVDSTLLRQQMLGLNRQGKTSEAIALGEKLAVLSESAADWYDLGSLYQQQNDLTSAIRCLRKAREAAPQNSQVCARLADLVAESKAKDEATALYQEAIALDPGHVVVRDKLRAVAGQSSFLDELIPAEAYEPVGIKGKSQGIATVLFDEGRTVVHSDSAATSMFRWVVQVHNEKGVEALSRQYAPALGTDHSHTLMVARIIKPDGKVVDVRDKSGDRTCSFPSLQPGDITETIWRVDSLQTGGLANQYWSHWSFDGSLPVQRGRFLIATHQAVPLKMKNFGKASGPIEKKQGDWTIREWKSQSWAALTPAMFSVPVGDRTNSLAFSTIANWGDVANWYYDLAKPLCKASGPVRNKALELTAGLKSEEEKIRALHQYVVDGIRYQTTPFRNSAFIPTAGKKVLAEAYGDCKDKAALLCAMLDVVGIPADMVLISTRKNGLQAPLPSPWFNHAITRIHTKKGMLWLDGTTNQPDLNVLPVEDQQALALVASPGTKELILTPIAPVQHNQSLRQIGGTLDKSGQLKGHFRFVTSGTLMELIRPAYESMSDEEKQTTADSIASKLFGSGAQTSHVKIAGVTSDSSKLQFDMDFSCPQFGQKVGSQLVYRLPDISAGLETLGKPLSKSNCDLDLILLRGVERTEFSIDIPAGYRLSNPASKKKASPMLNYEFSLSQAKQQVRLTTQFQFATSVVDRKKQAQLKLALDESMRAVDSSIVLQR